MRRLFKHAWNERVSKHEAQNADAFLAALVGEPLNPWLPTEANSDPEADNAELFYSELLGRQPMRSLDLPSRTALAVVPTEDPPAASADPLAESCHQSIVQLARLVRPSRLIDYRWPDRGPAPIGYLRGMALTYGRVYCKWKAGDPFAVEMAKREGHPSEDALAWYGEQFRTLGMDNQTDGLATLRHVFVLLVGLGMSESDGRYSQGPYGEGRRKASNVSPTTAEAGLFQMSHSVGVGSTTVAGGWLKRQYDALKLRPYSGLENVFSEGVTVTADELTGFGTGSGGMFREFCVREPALCTEVAALGVRRRRAHWSTITDRHATLNPDCDALFREVEQTIDRAGCCGSSPRPSPSAPATPPSPPVTPPAPPATSPAPSAPAPTAAVPAPPTAASPLPPPRPGYVRFPSGVELREVQGAIGNREEHWDPTNEHPLPLLDTSEGERDKSLAKDFSVREFTKNDNGYFDKARIDPELVKILQRLRDAIGKRVAINSGYRSWKYNRTHTYAALEEKDVPLSQHCSGKAADIEIEGLSALEMGKLALRHGDHRLSIGVDSYKNYVHIDVRALDPRKSHFSWAYNQHGAQQPGPHPETEAYREQLLSEMERALAAQYIAQGNSDEARLTDAVFHALHTERRGEAIRNDETVLRNQWQRIRQTVRSLLAANRPPAS